MTYQCKNCNFKIEGQKKLRCPNCGEAETLIAMPSASDILRDIDSIEESTFRRKRE
jgi:peptide subunit release factor 1 (eRF1)